MHGRTDLSAQRIMISKQNYVRVKLFVSSFYIGLYIHVYLFIYLFYSAYVEFINGKSLLFVSMRFVQRLKVKRPTRLKEPIRVDEILTIVINKIFTELVYCLEINFS